MHVVLPVGLVSLTIAMLDADVAESALGVAILSARNAQRAQKYVCTMSDTPECHAFLLGQVLINKIDGQYQHQQ